MFMVNYNNLSILGSTTFLSLLDELGFNNILNSTEKFNHDQKIPINVLFIEKLNSREIKNYLTQDVPTIILLKDKDYIKKKKLILLNFHVSLILPIEILSFKEVLNILATKYSFFKKSRIFIKNYEIDSNERSIKNQKIKVKLTEKELELILTLNNKSGLDKSSLLRSIWKHSFDLDTHTLETHLYRLRKKIYKYFKDKNFIIEKNSLYYLKN